MNVPMWFGWIIVVVLAVISILIFTGKGAFLIAGFNSLKEEEKKEYNVATLCKVIGSGMGIITVIAALTVYFNGELPSIISWIVPWGIFSTIFLMFILGNTICKK